MVCLGGEANVVLELSLTVPITNSLAFLFTVLGEWWAEGKVISRGTPGFTQTPTFSTTDILILA